MSKRWILQPSFLEPKEEDYQIKPYGWTYGYHLLSLTNFNHLGFITSLDPSYPTVQAGHEFVPFTKDNVSNEHRCQRCGLRAIKNNNSFTLHSRSWGKASLTGAETCNELLMRRVLE